MCQIRVARASLDMNNGASESRRQVSLKGHAKPIAMTDERKSDSAAKGHHRRLE